MHNAWKVRTKHSVSAPKSDSGLGLGLGLGLELGLGFKVISKYLLKQLTFYVE